MDRRSVGVSRKRPELSQRDSLVGWPTATHTKRENPRTTPLRASARQAVAAMDEERKYSDSMSGDFGFRKAGQACIDYVRSLPAADEDMLPEELAPHADEWYRLCERRFAVDRITISGPLAEAIVAAIGRRQGER